MKLLDGLLELEKHLVADNLKAIAMAEIAMGVAGRIVQKDAQDRIGEYQEAVGGFPAWKQLAESTEAEKARLGYPADAPLLRTGDMRDSIETEHNALEAIIGSKDPVAKYQELGTNRIPPRPFLGPAAFAKKHEIHAVIGSAVASAIGGNPTISAHYEIKK